MADEPEESEEQDRLAPVDYQLRWLRERDAHRELVNEIVIACADLNWATDGTDAAALRHLYEVVDRWHSAEARLTAIAARLEEVDAMELVPVHLMRDIEALIEGQPMKRPRPGPARRQVDPTLVLPVHSSPSDQETQVVPAPLPEFPGLRRFVLRRHLDVSGVSGVGTVCYGIAFPDGKVVTRWRSDTAQTCVWDSIADVEAIHGHGGATEVEWLD